jgi:hypothetical protein
MRVCDLRTGLPSPRAISIRTSPRLARHTMRRDDLRGDLACLENSTAGYHVLTFLPCTPLPRESRLTMGSPDGYHICTKNGAVAILPFV